MRKSVTHLEDLVEPADQVRLEVFKVLQADRDADCENPGSGVSNGLGGNAAAPSLK